MSKIFSLLNFFFILRTFKRYTVVNLLAFVLKIVTNMAAAKYSALKPQVDLVEAAQIAAQVAETAAANKGKLQMETRDLKVAAMLVEMDVLVNMMENIHTENITFYTEAGFETRKEPAKYEGEIPAPEWKSVANNIKKGSVRCRVKSFPKSANQLVVRCSADDGVTWPFVFFSGGQTVYITGLEKQKDHLFSACFHGTRQRESDWSANAELFVL